MLVVSVASKSGAIVEDQYDSLSTEIAAPKKLQRILFVTNPEGPLSYLQTIILESVCTK